MAGVIPVIFASLACSTCRADAAQFNQHDAGRPSWLVGRRGSTTTSLDRRPPGVHGDSTSPMIVFFTYFYVAITFNPEEVADNMKKYGGFIPGIRAGKPTADYLQYVLVQDHPAGRALPGLRGVDPADRARADQRQPELPVRRHLDPDHGRRRHWKPSSRSMRQLQQRQLRRASAMTRLLIIGPPGAGKGTQAAADLRALRRRRRSPPATSSVPTSRAARRWASKPRSTWTPASSSRTSVTNKMVRDRISESPTPKPASSWTATRAPLAQVD